MFGSSVNENYGRLPDVSSSSLGGRRAGWRHLRPTGGAPPTDRIATMGLLAAGMTVADFAAQAVTPALLLPLLALGRRGRRHHQSSRELTMIVAQRTPARRSGKGLRLRISGLDVGSFPGAAVFGVLKSAGVPSIISGSPSACNPPLPVNAAHVWPSSETTATTVLRTAEGGMKSSLGERQSAVRS